LSDLIRILIAEDDRSSRRLLSVNLINAGYEVAEAEDGQKAWEALQREKFRFVITDWMMPKMTGLDLIRRIRSEIQNGYIYTIVVTALEDKASVVEGLGAGADDYLTKPYYSEELLARVKIGERILQLEDRLREAHEQMEYQAMHDALTGLLNRRAIQIHAEAEAKRATRASAALSLLLLDVDNFKAINDRYGHLVGDQALQTVAKVLSSNVRQYDWVGRWGGEEFLCVLPSTSQSEAGQAAERIRSSVAAVTLTAPDSSTVHMTVSIGVACIEGYRDVIWLDKLIQSADHALYKAKTEGRNRVCLAD
jgi:two-component system chemotaxis response regulator CheY